jgi:hypothetical protein
VVVVATWIRAWVSPEILIPLGTSIRFDDFTFAIVGSRTLKAETSGSERQYLVVSLKVENEAKRVPYRFRRSTLVMVDDDGREHHVAPTGQKVLDADRKGIDPLAAPLPAGSSGVTELAFELPRKTIKPRFKISHGGPVLDCIDDIIGGKRRLTP